MKLQDILETTNLLDQAPSIHIPDHERKSHRVRMNKLKYPSTRDELEEALGLLLDQARKYAPIPRGTEGPVTLGHIQTARLVVRFDSLRGLTPDDLIAVKVGFEEQSLAQGGVLHVGHPSFTNRVPMHRSSQPFVAFDRSRGLDHLPEDLAARVMASREQIISAANRVQQ